MILAVGLWYMWASVSVSGIAVSSWFIQSQLFYNQPHVWQGWNHRWCYPDTAVRHIKYKAYGEHECLGEVEKPKLWVMVKVWWVMGKEGERSTEFWTSDGHEFLKFLSVVLSFSDVLFTFSQTWYLIWFVSREISPLWSWNTGSAGLTRGEVNTWLIMLRVSVLQCLTPSRGGLESWIIHAFLC